MPPIVARITPSPRPQKNDQFSAYQRAKSPRANQEKSERIYKRHATQKHANQPKINNHHSKHAPILTRLVFTPVLSIGVLHVRFMHPDDLYRGCARTFSTFIAKVKMPISDLAPFLKGRASCTCRLSDPAPAGEESPVHGVRCFLSDPRSNSQLSPRELHSSLLFHYPPPPSPCNNRPYKEE